MKVGDLVFKRLVANHLIVLIASIKGDRFNGITISNGLHKNRYGESDTYKLADFVLFHGTVTLTNQ